MPLRVLLVKDDTDVKALGKTVLASKLSSAQTESALASLAAINPHIDLTNIAAGTVLLVPDVPSFKVTAGDAVHDDAFGEFEKLVKAARTGIGERLDSGASARRAERAALTSALKLAAVQRLVKGDAELKQQLDVATASLKAAQQDDTNTAKVFDEAGQGITDALDALRKLMG